MTGTTTMTMGKLDNTAINAVATEVLEACALVDGKLTLPDAAVLAFSSRIQSADDKQGWGTAMIALSQRLRALPGAAQATERVLALAALALGDREVARVLSVANKTK